MPALAEELKVFAGRSVPALARKMCEHVEVAGKLGIPLGKARTEEFPDGELIVKLDEDVRGRDCFIVQSTSPPVNETLVELLIWIDCMKRASAARITAVIQYFGYARQDRKSEGRTPITAKLGGEYHHGGRLRPGDCDGSARGADAGVFRYSGGSFAGVAGVCGILPGGAAAAGQGGGGIAGPGQFESGELLRGAVERGFGVYR
jgi:hypothetical protein